MIAPAKSGKRPSILLTPIGNAQDFAAAFAVSQTTLERLAVYERLLRRWQGVKNLVAASTLEVIWHRHFADSAQLLALFPGARTWVDIGSGAGFPGLVVAILLAERTPDVGPGPRVSLIESNARKSAFLGEVVRQTGILGRVAVDILSTRAESPATQARVPGPEVITARAVAPLERLLRLAAPLCGRGTVGAFLKGREATLEIEAAERLWNFEIELFPSRTDPEGRIVVIRHLELRAKAPHRGRLAKG